MTADMWGALYSVADDYECDTLDDLRVRAGLAWKCEDDPDADTDTGCGWLNLAADDVCGGCGQERPE